MPGGMADHHSLQSGAFSSFGRRCGRSEAAVSRIGRDDSPTFTTGGVCAAVAVASAGW